MGPKPNPRLVPCRDPSRGFNHDSCPTCRGTGLLLFEPETGELSPCRLRQEITHSEVLDLARLRSLRGGGG